MSGEPSPQLRERIENTIRFLVVDAVEKASSGHPGAPMGLARPAFELWDRHLRFDPADPKWPLRDRFVLSNGHASMLLYSLLHLFVCAPLDEIVRFRQLGPRRRGTPEFGETPGVEVTTGPLGQGFAHGVGMALAGRPGAGPLRRRGRRSWTPLRMECVRRRPDGGDLLRGGSLAGTWAREPGSTSDDNRSHRRPHLALLQRGRGRPLRAALVVQRVDADHPARAARWRRREVSGPSW
jgi:hypothetical protein